MARSLELLLERLPRWSSTAMSGASVLLATAGAALMLLAAVYGDFAPALWATVAFALAGFLWHVADRT
jgi:hypothetical protein